MTIDKFKYETIVTAERGKYLKLVDEEINEEKIGKPERIIFSNSSVIPEFVEVPLEETKSVEVKDVKETKVKKTTKKKSSK